MQALDRCQLGDVLRGKTEKLEAAGTVDSLLRLTEGVEESEKIANGPDGVPTLILLSKERGGRWRMLSPWLLRSGMESIFGCSGGWGRELECGTAPALLFGESSFEEVQNFGAG